ncbi:hypothetical protein CYMTET_28815 [Cymbomonas tetramitiformis]|uniref:EGF-like domain-containing protein n=1 Tax=Cymbomonas tetramitiformis TaxID=36881 RepID=A0AAE0KVI8_9CHLO|nr:hypothetical protein CYMTET_28815 [Cymbomonas tetramitiformis]
MPEEEAASSNADATIAPAPSANEEAVPEEEAASSNADATIAPAPSASEGAVPEEEAASSAGGTPAVVDETQPIEADAPVGDPCTTLSPCDVLVTCTPSSAAGGYKCGACPAGYTGDGMTCTDIDECAAADNGGCAVQAECTNTAGGRTCGGCPEGMLGSGDSRCLPSSDSCAENNGGCDTLTMCNDGGGAVSCGECPAGYVGNGASGCIDEDACAAAGTEACYGACVDAQAPGTGYVCAPCPADMVGDGTSCIANLCFDGNGGCDAMVTCAMDLSSRIQTCGECPCGYAPEQDPLLSSGWRCAEVDGCVAEPCWSEGGFSQPCTDIRAVDGGCAPGAVRVCGACPAGFEAAEGGAGCRDVDECVQENGNCWVLAGNPAAVRTECVNKPGGRECGACPEGYIGTGEAGCRERVLCDNNHGNCDPLSTCADNPTTGYADCGPCPPGYSGTGDTACVDADGCALEPCFPGVECADVAAPGEGRTCGSCPEGYRGDGASCEMCMLMLSFDARMSTVVEGAMKRSAINQLAGSFGGLSEADCVLTQGVQYMWHGVSSAGTTVALDSTTNMRETLTLYLPRSTLPANMAYTMRLAASLQGNAQVAATVDAAFQVDFQPLAARIQGGLVHTGEGLPVELDASHSYDPDDEPGDMTYSWTCMRQVAAEEEPYCRDVDGTLLPVTMTTAALTLTLKGSQEGSVYILACKVKKADREARASTTVTIVRGAPPVPAISPLPGKQHTADLKLTIASSTESLRLETLVLAWSVEPADDATPALDLTRAASTALDLPTLVVRPGSLSAGGAYLFTLHATDANGPSQAGLVVRVNSPPHSGTLLPPAPSDGIMSQTLFRIEASGWEDDVEDKPLWYQLRYEVAGNPSGARVLLTGWQPSPLFTTDELPSGLEANGYELTLYLYVKDALGAMSQAAATVIVRPIPFTSEEAQAEFVNGAIDGAVQGATNGQDTSSAIYSIMSAGGLTEDASHRRRSLLGLTHADEDSQGTVANNDTARQAQREALMGLVATVWAALPPTTDTVTRVAQSAAAVAGDPAELTPAARGSLLSTAESMVAVTRTGDPDAALDGSGATELVKGLSSVTAGAVGGGNQSAEVSAAVAVVRSIGQSMVGTMTSGEEPFSVATEVLSAVAQRDDLSSSGSRAFREPVLSPSGAAVALPASLGAALGENGSTAALVDIMVVSCAVDAHADHGREEGSILSASNMTSITLYSPEEGGELGVQGLQEAMTFSLPIQLPANHTDAGGAGGTSPAASSAARAPFLGARCVYWDEAEGAYSSAGCTTLPNPAPPGSSVFWRTRNVSGLAALEAAWAVEDLPGEDGSSNLTAGCAEEWGAVFPEYLGTDGGRRKYLGEGCQLADPQNSVRCWWEWRKGVFEGPGCVWATEAECLCTHLTDFAAAQQTQVGEVGPPDRVSTVSTEEMARVSLDDVAQSTILLSVLATFMLGAPLLYLMSNWFHNRERFELLLKLMSQGGQTFKEIDDMWTWSMVDSTHNRPGLGSFLLELGAKERARLRAECMGNASLRATLAVSKWRKKSNKSEGSTSGAISTAELPMLSEEGEETEEEEEEEVEVAAAEKPELSALQKKVRRAYRKNSFMNMMSTASTLSLMGKQEKYAVAEPAGEHTGGPSHVGTQKECADNAAACSTAQDGAAQPMAASGAPEGTRMAAKEEEEETPTLSVARVAANGGAPSSQPSSPVWASLVFAPENSEERAPPSRSDSGSVLLDLNSSSCKLAPPPTPSQKQRLHKRQPEAKAEMVPGEVPLESGDLHISDDGDCYEVSETITTVTTSTTRTTRTKHRPRDTRATPSPGPVAESTQRQAETELGLGAHLLGGSPGAPGNASVDSRASAGAAQSGRAGAVRGSVFTGIRGSVTSMIHALGGVSVKRLRSLKTKKKAPTARVLFASMHINVFRLQQCVPLDYLEEQAQLEVADDERRRRHQERSAQAKHEVTAEMRLAGDRMLEKVSKDYGGNQVKGNRSAQPVMESVDPTILAKSLTRRFDAVPSYKDVMKQLEDEEQAKRLKIQTRWDKLRKRNMELPVERMLGTALVQAFLGIKAIISKADLAEQARLADMAPWQMPNNRPFTWYVSTFKVLIGSIARDGWFQRSWLWNCVFLQRVNGSFEMSGFLASMLKAGEPIEPLSLNPISPHDVAVLEASVPALLQDVLDAKGAEGNAQLQTRVREVWATLLVMQFLEHLPFAWTENPNEPPEAHITLRGRSAMFLQHFCDTEFPQLHDALPELEQEASRLNEIWQHDHELRVIQLYEDIGPKAEKKKLLIGDMTYEEKCRKLQQVRHHYWLRAKRTVKWLTKAHPLGAIFLITAVEPFSRSERILIQANTFILMLMFTVWFYYSKAVNCCKDFREFVSCPDSWDVNAPCLGFLYCAELKDAAPGMMLPEEALPADFFCTAFPQSTFVGRFWVILIIVGILTPTTMTLSQMFIMAQNVTIPEHWGVYVTKKAERCFGAVPMAVMQTVFVTLYALFFNFQKFNKAMAVTFVAIIGLTMKPRHIRRAIAFVVQSYKRCMRYMSVAAALVVQMVTGAKQRVEKTEYEELLEKVHLVSPVEEHLQQLAYFIILVSWFTCAWVLFTFSMLIREMMGDEAEAELVASWATVLAVEMFGKEAIKLICIRLFVESMMNKAEQLFTGQDHPAHRWFEQYILLKLTQDSRVTTDDTGDQDMGDDADADGGGDDEIDAGDDDIGGGIDM